MSRVALRRLVKRYRQTEVVKGVDLEIAEGEFVVLLGPSGCGKTTTLRIIAGFTAPTSGEVRIGGEIVDRLPPRARNLGMVFQDYALFPNMTVADNIGFGLVERGTPRALVGPRVTEMLALMRMEGLGGRYPSELSGGQQQRVALARALAYQPRVLLMDEPLGALDQKLREEMQREFGRIQRALGTTTVFVTHDQQEAMALADRIVVMNTGRIEQVGRPEELYRKPGSLFIAGFIGRSNLIPGTVERRAGSRVAVRSEGGDLLLAHAIQDFAEGQRVVCVVRPEQLLLADGAEPSPDRNAIRAKLLRRSFFGSSIDLILVDEAGRELIVQASDDAEPPSDSGEVTASFAADATICFPAPSGA
jgi:putative spermidine/putrescine transport system ATP-binding protein